MVTDTAAALPPEVSGRLGIRTVPLGLTIDGHATSDADIDPDSFFAALGRGAQVTTSQPAPGHLAAAYEDAARDGVERVWSIHLGSALSSTVDAARLVASAARISVEVADTGTASMAEGLCVLAAVAALQRDGDADVRQVVAAEAAAQANVFISLAPGNIAAGGRGAHAVDMFDILCLRAGGQIEKVARAGSREAAVEMMASMLSSLAGGLVAIGDGGAPGLGEALFARCRELAPGRRFLRYPVPPSIAVHTGPTVGYVVSQLDPEILHA
ncbi:MAG: DegV family protein [Candidatus Dormibacteria bacterium]